MIEVVNNINISISTKTAEEISEIYETMRMYEYLDSFYDFLDAVSARIGKADCYDGVLNITYTEGE